jgi:hypothetical protein
LRKAFSIFLLLVLLFNMVGYRAWFFYAEKQSDAAMEAALDKNAYQENDLITIQIPLNNPYLLEEGSFQRINGEVNYQGKNYRFVKRKIAGGNLILQCLPDTRKMVLKKAKTEYGNVANDLANSGKSSSRSGTQKNYPGNDYICHTTDLLTFQYSPVILEHTNPGLSNYIDPYLAFPAKPPQYRA